MEPCSSNWKSQRLCNLVVPSDIRVVTSCGSCPCSKATVNDNPESFLSLKSDLAAEYPLVDAGSTAGGIPTFRLTITTLPVASPGPYSTSLSFAQPTNASNSKVVQAARKYLLYFVLRFISYMFIIKFSSRERTSVAVLRN